ncbi:MAG: protoheme IX farnesyltransferase, partial [Gammaproteobacteria bacterium]
MNDQAAIVEQTPKWREYYNLCKPKVVILIIFTAVVGMLLAVPGALPLGRVIYATLGIGLAAASGAAINQLVEQRI